MATPTCDYGSIHNSSQRRGAAMLLAIVIAVVLSPLYVNSNQKETHLETRLWNSGFVLPMVLAGLIVAIKTTSSSSSSSSATSSSSSFATSSCEGDTSSSRVLRIGSSSWGLAGILGMLMFVLYWQHSVQHLLWR